MFGFVQQLQLAPQLVQKQEHKLGMWLTFEMREQGIPILESSIEALDEIAEKELAENPELRVEDYTQSDYADSWDNSACSVKSTRKDVWATSDSSYYENTLVESESLYRHLLKDLQQSSLTESEQQIGAALVAELDENGFLTTPIELIAANLHVAIRRVERILFAIQELAPAGVGARTLQECYLLQLKRHSMDNSLASFIVRDFWSELKAGKVSKICNKSAQSREAVTAALKQIAKLNMRPGGDFSPQPVSVVPDALVSKAKDGQWQVSINRGRTGTLTVNLAALPQEVGREGLAFYKNLRRTAARFVDMVAFRNQTLFDVVSVIVRRQQVFLEQGEEFLVPLTQAEIAREVGFSEATLCRLAKSKYLQTPQGTRPLHFFFDSGVKTFSGGQIAARAVKARLVKLVATEDRTRPLSDQELTNRLVAQRIDISCRAVNKYRLDLQLGSTRERRLR